MPSAHYLLLHARRLIGAVLVGALTGGLATASRFVWGTANNLGVEYIIRYGLIPTLTIFISSFVVWLAGLAVCGTPCWYVLHKRGLRSWYTAALLGVTLTFLVSFAIQTDLFQLLPAPINSNYSASDNGGPLIVNNRLTPHGWWETAYGSLINGVAGMVVALVIWRIAYRRSIS